MNKYLSKIMYNQSGGNTENEIMVLQDLAGEIEAIIQYSQHINATNSTAVKTVLTGIRDEEKVHMGELITLLIYLNPTWATFLDKGEEEVKELLKPTLN